MYKDGKTLLDYCRRNRQSPDELLRADRHSQRWPSIPTNPGFVSLQLR